MGGVRGQGVGVGGLFVENKATQPGLPGAWAELCNIKGKNICIVSQTGS